MVGSLQKLFSKFQMIFSFYLKGMLFYESRPCRLEYVWLYGKIQILFSRNKYSSPQGQLYYINKPLVISHYFIEKGRCYDSPTYIAML